MKPYLLDGKPVDDTELIAAAKDNGFDGDAFGVYYTSRAARILRDKGHKVEENKKS